MQAAAQAKRTNSRTRKHGKSTMKETVTREYSLNIHKKVHGIGFKKRVPRAIKVLKKFAIKEMGTTDVRIDPHLNKQLWVKGIRKPPNRIRVRISRIRNEDANSSQKFYTIVSHVPVPTFKRLQTTCC